MARPARSLRPAHFILCGTLLAAGSFGVGRLAGIQTSATAPGAASRAALLTSAVAAERDPAGAAAPGFTGESVVQAQRKRIMGRMRSLEMVRRVTRDVRPLVERALEQPELQPELRRLATDAGMSLPEYRRYFAAKQEADLLLESGGDPNARSVANALGVAQYLAGTGRRCGLRIDEGASNRLSREIARLEADMEWLASQPGSWSRSVPAALRGVVPAVRAGGAAEASQVPVQSAVSAVAGAWSRDQWLAYRESQRERLLARRRVVDERFDPAKAIAAQSRYLARLALRYGGVDWALQAYHGGEAGAERTLRLFRGAARRTQLASRGYSGSRLPFGELYRRVTPLGTPEAFSYLFGRSDDHRYYWWKVLMAERALALFRRDPDAFERQWRALQPGQSSDAAFYPEAAPLQFAGDAELRAAYAAGELAPLPAYVEGLRAGPLASLRRESGVLHRGLRPEAMGALLRIARLYRESGGRAPVPVAALVQSASYRALWEIRYPRAPLPPGVPADPEFHTTGMTFDLEQPADDWDRKVLEFALGRLYDSLRISWRPERDGGTRRYHVVVNPAYRGELAAYHQRATRAARR